MKKYRYFLVNFLIVLAMIVYYMGTRDKTFVAIVAALAMVLYAVEYVTKIERRFEN